MSWFNFLLEALPPIMHLCVLKLLQSCPTFCNPTDYTRKAPASMGFSRLEYWSGLPCPPPGDPPDPGIEPTSLLFPALTGGFFTTRATWEVPYIGTGKFYFIQTYLPLPQMYEL